MSRSEKFRSLTLGSRRGMSLVEIMVVIAIVLVVTSVLSTGVFRAFLKAQVSTSWLAVVKTEGDVRGHSALRGGLPTEAQGLATIYGPDDVPHDAWGTELQYERPTEDFDIVSWGNDKAEGGEGFATDLRSSER